MVQREFDAMYILTCVAFQISYECLIYTMAMSITLINDEIE